MIKIESFSSINILTKPDSVDFELIIFLSSLYAVVLLLSFKNYLKSISYLDFELKKIRIVCSFCNILIGFTIQSLLNNKFELPVGISGLCGAVFGLVVVLFFSQIFKPEIFFSFVLVLVGILFSTYLWLLITSDGGLKIIEVLVGILTEMILNPKVYEPFKQLSLVRVV